MAASTVGGGNTAVGNGAMRYNAGSLNTAVGALALRNNTGDYNTAMGDVALNQNTSGSYNTAVGQYALYHNTVGSFNSAFGRAAMASTTSGISNVAVGSRALGDNTVGFDNTAIGDYALRNSTGNDNTALGQAAGYNLTTGSNNIMIGSYGVAGESGAIRIGGGPQTATFIDGIHGVTSSGGIGVFVNAAGQLGTATSSRRFKEDIGPVGEESKTLFELRPVSFRYTEEAAGPKVERPLEYGLIAEEVAEVWPELVPYDEEGRPATVRYHLLVALLLAELQRERERSEMLLARVEALERRRGGGRQER